MSRNKKMHREERMIEEISIFWAMLFSLEESTNCRAPTSPKPSICLSKLENLNSTLSKDAVKRTHFFKICGKMGESVLSCHGMVGEFKNCFTTSYSKLCQDSENLFPLFDLTMSHTPHFVGITAKRMRYIKLFFFSTFLKLSTMSAEEIGKCDENSFPCTQGVSGW